MYSPLEGLLGADELQRLKGQAQNTGLINLGAALLAGSAPSLTPTSLGGIVGRAAPAYQQGYEQTFDTTLSNIIKGNQVKEMLRKQQEAEQIKKVLASAAVPQYQTSQAVVPEGQTLYDDMGQLTYGATPEQKKLVGMTYDMKSVIPTLQALGRFDLLKDIGESQKAIRQSGLMSDTQAPSPFAPYMMAQNPQVRQLAKTYDQGFRSGVIDEETAYKRNESLARMEDNFLSRQESRADRALTREQGKKPTENERLSAGFAQRMEFSEQKASELENKYAQDMLTKGSQANVPYPTVGMSVAGSLPLIGGYARSKVASDEQALYRQAQENWVRANLRKESGAAIPPDEMDAEIATYFPTAGELSNPKIIAQKRQARQVTMDAMRKNAGVAYEPFNMAKFFKDNELEGRK